jgi:ribonuclease P protein component
MNETSYSFQRELRLLCAKDYSHVFDKAVKVNNKAFTLLARSNSFDHPRIGLVIAKKNLKFAHQRNRVKRVLREGFRLQQATFDPYDIVILTRRDIAVMSKQEILNYRNDLFSRFQRKCKRS